MSGLVFGGITPHGSSIIGEIAGNEYELFSPLREGMELFGQRLKEHNVDTIVILTPHGLRLKGYNAIYTSEYCRGTLSQYGNSVSAEFKCDKTMALNILSRIEAEGIACVGCNYGALEGPASNIEMDWGTLVLRSSGQRKASNCSYRANKRNPPGAASHNRENYS